MSPLRLRWRSVSGPLKGMASEIEPVPITASCLEHSVEATFCKFRK